MSSNTMIFNPKTKVWGSLKQQESYDPSMFGQMILNALSKRGSKLAQINDDNGVQITYHEMWLKTVRAAQNLQKLGVQPHQVHSFMVNHADYLTPIILASMCLGCPINAMHPLLSKQEISQVLTTTKPSILFCSVDEYKRIVEVLTELKMNLKILTLDGNIDGIASVEELFVETGTENSFEPIRIHAENDAVGVFCSSGTTGPSKCLRISYGSALPWISSSSVHRIDGRVVCFDSAYWSVGLYFILGYLKCGATRIITTKPYSSELLMKIIEKHQITTLWSGLFQLVACVKNAIISEMNLSSVSELFCYGAKVPSHIATEIHRYFTNAHTTAAYGMTEIGVVCQSSSKSHVDNSAGPLIDDCLAKIVDKNGVNCDPGVVGEVCIKKRYKFLGYLGQPALSDAAIDSDGFIRTGDIGYFDANTGILHIQDRKKNCILNVFYFRGMILPIEIEEFLISLPDVKEVCVVGVHNTPGSELPAALIVRHSDSNLNQQDIFNAVAGKFPKRSWLRAGVYFVESLPKTNSGKPMRPKIKTMAAELFKAAKQNDPIAKSFLKDIPAEFQHLI